MELERGIGPQTLSEGSKEGGGHPGGLTTVRTVQSGRSRAH